MHTDLKTPLDFQKHIAQNITEQRLAVSNNCMASGFANMLETFINTQAGVLNNFVEVRSSPQELFLGKGVLKICRKVTKEHPGRSVISIELLCKFIEMILRH